jgi:hypothetical protein
MANCSMWWFQTATKRRCTAQHGPSCNAMSGIVESVAYPVAGKL